MNRVMTVSCLSFYWTGGKKKKRILIGKELQIHFRLHGNADADVLCDVTRPLGIPLAEFEHDSEGK